MGMARAGVGGRSYHTGAARTRRRAGASGTATTMTELRAIAFIGVVLFGYQTLAGELTPGSALGLGTAGLILGLTGTINARRRAGARRPIVRVLAIAYLLLSMVMAVVIALALKWIYLSVPAA